MDKARKAAVNMLGHKYSESRTTDTNISLTVPAELKYFNFNESGIIKKQRVMTNSEVIYFYGSFTYISSYQMASLLRGLGNTERTFPNPGSAAMIIIQIEDAQYVKTGELKGACLY